MLPDKKILSVDSDDEEVDYNAFSKYLEDDTERRKKKTAEDIRVAGDELLKEIGKKKMIQTAEKLKYIKYITKHSIHDSDDLLSYDINDVREIYNELRKVKESKIKNFFYFLFNP